MNALSSIHAMKCGICGQQILTDERIQHLGGGQHNLDTNLIAWIIEFDDRLSKLESQFRINPH